MSIIGSKWHMDQIRRQKAREENAWSLLEALKAMVALARLGEIPAEVTLQRYEKLISEADPK